VAAVPVLPHQHPGLFKVMECPEYRPFADVQISGNGVHRRKAFASFACPVAQISVHTDRPVRYVHIKNLFPDNHNFLPF
jgi:hypothetical protein